MDKFVNRIYSILDYTICHRQGRIPFGTIFDIYNEYQRGNDRRQVFRMDIIGIYIQLKRFYLVGNSD